MLGSSGTEGVNWMTVSPWSKELVVVTTVPEHVLPCCKDTWPIDAAEIAVLNWICAGALVGTPANPLGGLISCTVGGVVSSPAPVVKEA